MPLPVVFAQLPQGDNPASLLDTQFTALAGFVVIPCAVTGQNILQIEPFADAPVVSALTDLSPVFAFEAAQNSTGNVTINVNNLGEFVAYKANGGALLTSGDLIAGNAYQAVFLSSLNGGAGGFIVNVEATGGGGGGAVSSVFGRTGAVMAAGGDYSFTQISGSVAPGQMPLFTSTANGIVAASGGGTVNFLRADGTWVPAPGGGGAGNITIGTTTVVGGTSGNVLYDNAGLVGAYSSAQLTAQIAIFTTALSGAVPASGGGTVNFLRSDGAWTPPPVSPVSSVFGRTGAVVAATGDYSFSQISGVATPSQLPLFTATANGAVSASGGGTINFLRADGTWVAPPGGGGSPISTNVAVFNANSTYTPTSGMQFAIVECWGGGGGGGGTTGSATTAGGGGGGGQGGYSRSILTATTIGASQTITIGVGDAAGTGTGSTAGNGGATSFGTLVIAQGGNGGQNQNFVAGAQGVGGQGGSTGGAGQLGLGGIAGTDGISNTAGGPPSYGGFGGGNTVAPGFAATGNATIGQSAINIAGGGNGAAFNAVAGATNGGAGFHGLCVVTEYFGGGGGGGGGGILPPSTVAGLPSPVSAGVGARGFVTDATSTSFASIVAGTGINRVPVYSDGTNWRIG